MMEKVVPDPLKKLRLSTSVDQQSEMLYSLFLLLVQVEIYQNILQLTHFISNAQYLQFCSIQNNLPDPLVIQHLIKAKNSRYLKSRYLEFLHVSNKFPGPLSSFLSLSQTFSKISKSFCNFSSEISIFQTTTATFAAILPSRMKDAQIDLFCYCF